MSVLVEALSVIVRRATVDTLYPGGLARYVRDCPNRTFCADAWLTRVGFMTPDDVGKFVARLEALSFVHVQNGQAADIVVVDQFVGPTTPCGWIHGGRHADGYSAAWLMGTPPGELAHPEGWTPAASQRMQFLSPEDLARRVLPLGTSGVNDVYLDLNTGRELYTGRPHVAPPVVDDKSQE